MPEAGGSALDIDNHQVRSPHPHPHDAISATTRLYHLIDKSYVWSVAGQTVTGVREEN
jgi:hypothetical protein